MMPRPSGGAHGAAAAAATRRDMPAELAEAIAAAAALSVPSPNERSKKSAAYLHTTPSGDESDKQQKRRCRYCAAVFSFRGGTTSAALRHLKTAHPELLQSPHVGASSSTADGVSGASADQLPLPPQQQQQLATRAVQHRSRKAAKPSRAPAKPQPASERPVALASAPTDAAHPAGAELSASTSQVASRSTPAPWLTPALRAPGSTTGATHVLADAAGTATDAQAPKPIPQQSQSQQQPQASSAHKRRRSDADGDGDARSLAPVSTSLSSSTPATATAVALDDAKPMTHAPQPSPALTPSQTAITHFLAHYKELLAPSNRLRFVKHLTHHVREAEMYNVLDEATQLEFIKEFVDPSP